MDDDFSTFEAYNPDTGVSDDLQNYDFYNPPAEDVTLPYYADYPSSGEGGYISETQAKALIQGQAPSGTTTPDLSSLFGKIIDTATKTYSQVAQVKYAQDYKVVPSVQTGQAKTIFQPLTRTKQTGLDMGILTQPEKGIVPGVSNIYLLVGAGLIFILIAMR